MVLYLTHTVEYTQELPNWFKELASAIKDSNMSIVEFCEQAEISRNTLYNPMNNSTKKDVFIRLKTVWHIYDVANGLGIPISKPPVPTEFQAQRYYKG